VGDQAILVIPAKLAYGTKGVPDVIPPDSTLIFIVELVDVKAKSMSDVLSTTLQEKGIEAMIAEFRRLKNSGDPDLYSAESDINGFGYQLLRNKKFNEAIEVFKLNVESYPQSANVYDSLGEAFMMQGDKEKAIENYERALAIDPKMQSPTRALKKLRGQ
jgi:tetratricopeptide (TPR) repeat protein